MSCNSPLTIEHNGVKYEVPCRWCMGCRIDRRNLWNFRIRMHQQELQKQGFRSSFVTLTYDDEHYQGGVCKRDITLFLKRLRKDLTKSKDVRNCRDFKYYIVSEFGENGDRGHYHGVFLGLECDFLKGYLRKNWQKGFVQVAPLIPQRISYTLKYMDKQQFGESAKVENDVITRIPFVLCSKGIGSNYLRQIAEQSVESGVIWSTNRFIKFPSYYANKFGIDLAKINDKNLKYLERKAKENKMSVREYTLHSRLVNEKRLVSNAHNSDMCVSDSALKTAESYFNKSNVGEHYAKELNNDDV